MLGGLAMKWRWREARKAAGKPSDRPNLVMGSNVQVVWEKFCRYFDVEMRLVDVDDQTWHLMPDPAVAACDENTIGVIAVLGSTYDGSYEPVADIAAALDEFERTSGLDIPMHVDGASGGFIAPFIDPELVWDFRLPRVVSINTSGHKFGLVYPGVGWVVWRSKEFLPEDLIFHVAYLGGDMPTLALNFSRPGAQIVAQYYNFIRLGHEGYRAVQQACRDVAMHISSTIAALGPFELVSDGSELPVVAFRMKEGSAYTVYDVSDRLRMHGWTVPAYPMPPAVEDVHVLRVVIRNGMSMDMAEMLLSDLAREIDILDSVGSPGTPDLKQFSH
jgi:glutamate decarboxylase